MARLLVTGASGFVGHAVSLRAVELGFETHVLTRARGRAGKLSAQGAVVHEGSVSSPDEVAAAATGCSLIIHAAAASSCRYPSEMLRWINVAGTENVITAAKHTGCRRIVLVSCADVSLIDGDRIHWDETKILNAPPIDEHAQTKLLAEEIALAHNSSGLEVTAIRPAPIWGPGDHTSLPHLCAEAFSGGIELFGSGETFYAVAYIDHVVDAVFHAAAASAAPGKAYYISDAETLECKELFSLLSHKLSLPPPRRGKLKPLGLLAARWRATRGQRGPTPTDVIRRTTSSWFNIQRAITELGYEPRITTEEGMSRLAEWVNQQGGAKSLKPVSFNTRNH